MKSLAILGGALLFSAASMCCLPWPFIWGFLAWTTALAALAGRAHRRKVKAALLAAAACLCIGSLFEGILWVFPCLGCPEAEERLEGGCVLGYSAVFGDGPQPNSRFRARMFMRNTLAYDVTYGIDSRGLRVTPGSNASRSLLFLGCSFTFGDGVEDHETLPHQVARMTRGRYRVFNFGRSGCGPHDILAMMETDVTDRIVGPVVPRLVLYQALPCHVRRAAGIDHGADGGPRYVLAEDGSLAQDGYYQPWHGTPGLLRSKVFKQVDKSSIGKRVLALRRPVTSRDVGLTLAIVSRLRDLVLRKWPRAEFHVLIWEDHPWIPARLIRGLAAAGIATHRISAAIPEINNDATPYEIPLDGHPNARAYGYIARYVVDVLLDDAEAPAWDNRSDARPDRAAGRYPDTPIIDSQAPRIALTATEGRR